MKAKVIAAKQYKFNLSLKLSMKDVINIIRERIARDNPGINPDFIYIHDLTKCPNDEEMYDVYLI